MKFYVVLMLIIIPLLFPSNSEAQQVKSVKGYQQLLSQGHALYQRKSYQPALSAYQQSFALEPLDSTLHNMAICHFKLKQWSQALARFEELNNNQQSVALIEYYIAVIHKKMDNTEQAIDGFYDLIQYSDDDSVVLMAMKQLKILTPLAVDSKIDVVNKPKSMWQHMIDMQVGYDSNVSLPYDGEEILFKEGSDKFVNFLANTNWMSSRNLANAWFFDATYFNSTYKEASDYDVGLIALNGRKYFSFDTWQDSNFYLGVAYDTISIAGKNYLNNSSGTLGSSFTFSSTQKFLVDLTIKNVSGGSDDYEYLAGSSNHVKLTWRERTDDGYWKAGMIFQQDDRNNRYTYTVTEAGVSTNEVDDFINYSTDRMSLFTSRFWGYEQWEFSVNANYRISEYDAENIVDGESVGIREDKRTSVVLSSAYNINDSFAVTTDIDWSKNTSTISSYDFNQYTVTVGGTWLF